MNTIIKNKFIFSVLCFSFLFSVFIPSANASGENIDFEDHYVKVANRLQKTYQPGDEILLTVNIVDEKGKKVSIDDSFNFAADIKDISTGVLHNYAYSIKSGKKSVTFYLQAPFKEGNYEIVFRSPKIETKSKIVFEVKNSAKKKEFAPLTKNEHYLSGDKKSPVKVITYSDIECPFCKKFHSTVDDLIKKYDKKVAFIYRHFPLEQIHPDARYAAEATECVAKLGGEDKFKKYLSKLFEGSPSSLSASYSSDLAASVGVNKKAFDSCMKNKEGVKEVEADIDAGMIYAKKDVQFGTPYSIVYGKKGDSFVIPGAQPYDVIVDLLDSVLKM